MNCAVLQFPGSNCDQDAVKAVASTLSLKADLVWHETVDLSAYDLIIVPGGFSYGDYLRAGAIARFSKAMHATVAAAERGAYVLGICNGFQILTEAGLLPGALRRNDHRQFRCDMVELEVVNGATNFTRAYEKSRVTIPIAHGEGNYYVDDEMLKRLEENQQIVFRYASEQSPNGSVANIAGVINERGNVLGMMPHPERAVSERLGSTDGISLFRSILTSWRDGHAS
ncbi:phosphoribosylformylglycinamidine synthase subunit PurQ [Ferroacidibacillus organovorans]|uniref:Phosphoribosylformylglycinamidine synthase subunit PurQ n=1 Tax=Ferroacidibacillus organovorans TaxID=1765683 RepID=A0A117SXK8_9BACL|nr:phosphoribosylformylglycinamidine synthase subunit PurQ [Ferroacidibacillus organovorans]KUO95420.1 phosphoribosylformylglycinamidine synthase [Ferroacidibacillus organovorans]